MTIEEAREKFGNKLRFMGMACQSEPESVPTEAVGAVWAAFDDAMLAVLDEAENIPTGRHGDVEAEALRTRIQQLGKEPA